MHVTCACGAKITQLDNVCFVMYLDSLCAGRIDCALVVELVDLGAVIRNSHHQRKDTPCKRGKLACASCKRNWGNVQNNVDAFDRELGACSKWLT